MKGLIVIIFLVAIIVFVVWLVQPPQAPVQPMHEPLSAIDRDVSPAGQAVMGVVIFACLILALMAGSR